MDALDQGTVTGSSSLLSQCDLVVLFLDSGMTSDT